MARRSKPIFLNFFAPSTTFITPSHQNGISNFHDLLLTVVKKKRSLSLLYTRNNKQNCPILTDRLVQVKVRARQSALLLKRQENCPLILRKLARILLTGSHSSVYLDYFLGITVFQINCSFILRLQQRHFNTGQNKLTFRLSIKLQHGRLALLPTRRHVQPLKRVLLYAILIPDNCTFTRKESASFGRF